MKIQSSVDMVARTVPDRSLQPVEAAANVRPQSNPGQGGGTNKENVDKVVEKMNSAASLFDKALKFKVHDGRRISVQVIDTSSGEIIREIPPEKLVEAFEAMEQHLGLLFDRKV